MNPSVFYVSGIIGSSLWFVSSLLYLLDAAYQRNVTVVFAAAAGMVASLFAGFIVCYLWGRDQSPPHPPAAGMGGDVEETPTLRQFRGVAR